MLIIELKKLVVLCQYKLYMKATTSFYSVIQQRQMHYFFLLFFCNLKEKVHIGRITNSKKNYLCVK